jgi:hypothetical protein
MPIQASTNYNGVHAGVKLMNVVRLVQHSLHPS